MNARPTESIVTGKCPNCQNMVEFVHISRTNWSNSPQLTQSAENILSGLEGIYHVNKGAVARDLAIDYLECIVAAMMHEVVITIRDHIRKNIPQLPDQALQAEHEKHNHRIAAQVDIYAAAIIGKSKTHLNKDIKP